MSGVGLLVAGRLGPCSSQCILILIFTANLNYAVPTCFTARFLLSDVSIPKRWSGGCHALLFVALSTCHRCRSLVRLWWGKRKLSKGRVIFEETIVPLTLRRAGTKPKWSTPNWSIQTVHPKLGQHKPPQLKPHCPVPSMTLPGSRCHVGELSGVWDMHGDLYPQACHPC